MQQRLTMYTACVGRLLEIIGRSSHVIHLVTNASTSKVLVSLKDERTPLTP